MFLKTNFKINLNVKKSNINLSKISKLILNLFLILKLFNCAIFQPLAEPAERIVRRGSCIAFELPPITLTSTQTAIERQLVGEEIQLEPNGWLLASSKNTTNNLKFENNKIDKIDVNEKVKLERRYQIEKGVLDYYEKNMLEYTNLNLIGESYEGYLIVVPISINKKQDLLERNLAIKVAKEINNSRSWIYNYLIKINDFNGAKNFIQSFYINAKKRIGEKIYTKEKKWEEVI